MATCIQSIEGGKEGADGLAGWGLLVYICNVPVVNEFDQERKGVCTHGLGDRAELKRE